MSVFKANLIIDSPIEKVWEFIANPMNAMVWSYGVSSVEVISEGKFGTGSKFKLILRDYFMQIEVKNFEENHLIVLEFIDGPATGSLRSYSIKRIRENTLIESDLQMRLRGIWKLFYPILFIREIKDRGLGISGIKKAIESGK